jgi:hypothetical protein
LNSPPIEKDETMYYAGIGSRKTPADTLEFMTRLARILASKGYTLRSGGAEGADTAFEKGAGKSKQIFRPKHATEEAIKLAMEVHPIPQHCNDYVRKLHGRNAQIILGWTLLDPVDFVVCWTPGGNTTGGTGLGIRLATERGIKVYNICNVDDMLELKERFLNE